jgi:hypothetical protein
MRSKIIASFLLLLFAVSCGGGDARNAQTLKLPSGKQVKVTSVGAMNFQQGGSALVMNYETEIPIENMEALRSEVNEIWSIFQADVEKAGAKAGVIRATHYEGVGMVRDGKGYGFVYVKGGDGKWRLQ